MRGVDDAVRRRVADGPGRLGRRRGSVPSTSTRYRSPSVCSATSAPARRHRRTSEMFVAVRALSRYRMLMLTLDRIGIRTPAVYAAAARHAARIGIARRPPRLRRAGAVSGRARAGGAHGERPHARRRRGAGARRAARGAVGQRHGPLWRRRRRLAAQRSRWQRFARADTVETAVLAAMSGSSSGEHGESRGLRGRGRRTVSISERPSAGVCSACARSRKAPRSTSRSSWRRPAGG